MKKTAVFDPTTYQKGLAQFTQFINHLIQFDNKHPAPVFTTKGLSDVDEDLVTSTKFWRIDQIKNAFDDGWKLNQNGYCVSTAINEFGRDGKTCKLQIPNVSRVRAQCIDLDIPLPVSVLKKIIDGIKPDIASFSSMFTTVVDEEEYTLTKAHFYFLYGPSSSSSQEQKIIDNYNILQQAIAYRIEQVCINLMKEHPVLPFLESEFLPKTKGHWTDKNITINKLMRVPGFWHQKNPNNSTHIQCKLSDTPSSSLLETYRTLMETFRVSTEWLDEVSKRQKTERKKTSTSATPTNKKGSPIYEETQDGGRNTEMLAYIWRLVCAKNKSKEEVTDIVYGANLRKNKPPLSEDRLDMMIEGAYQKLGDGFAQRDKMLTAPTEDRHEWKTEIKKEAHKAIRKYNYVKKIHENTLSDPAILSRLYDRYGDVIKGNYSLGHFCYSEDTGTWDHTMSRAITRMREVIQDMRYERYVQAHFASDDLKEDYDAERMDTYLNSKLAISTTRALVQSIVTDEEFQLSVEMLNRTPYLINAPNGIIDLTTGALLDHAPDEYMTGSVAVPYLGATETEQFLELNDAEDWNKGIVLHDPELCTNEAVYIPGLWQQFIYDIMEGDVEMCCFLQRIFGYAMFGHNKEQKAFFCIGNGDNGKSLCLETIQKLFGSYTGKNLPTEMLLNKTDKGSSYAASTLANLLYWRYALTGEVDNSKKWNENFFKDITTNGSITARRMREDSITFTSRFTLFVQGNKKPEFDGNDDAIWKRVCLIPFNLKVPQAHKNVFLENMLASPKGLHEILHWTVAGAMNYAKDGLQLPTKVADAIKDYKAEMLPFDEFFTETLLPMEATASAETIIKEGVTAKSVYDAYMFWCRMNDKESHQISPSAIGNSLTKTLKRVPVKTTTSRVFHARFTPQWQLVLQGDEFKRTIPTVFAGNKSSSLTMFNGNNFKLHK